MAGGATAASGPARRRCLLTANRTGFRRRSESAVSHEHPHSKRVDPTTSSTRTSGTPGGGGSTWGRSPGTGAPPGRAAAAPAARPPRRTTGRRRAPRAPTLPPGRAWRCCVVWIMCGYMGWSGVDLSQHSSGGGGGLDWVAVARPTRCGPRPGWLGRCPRSWDDAVVSSQPPAKALCGAAPPSPLPAQ